MNPRSSSIAVVCGISGPSIANGSINQGRLNTTTGSTSGSTLAGGITEWSFASSYAMYLSAKSISSFAWPFQRLLSEIDNGIAFKNTAAITYSYAISARTIST